VCYLFPFSHCVFVQVWGAGGLSSTPNVGMYDLCEVAPRTCLCRGYGPLYSRSGGTLGRVCERLETGWRPGVRPRQMNGNQQLPPGRLQTKLNTCARSQFVFLLVTACVATGGRLHVLRLLQKQRGAVLCHGLHLHVRWCHEIWARRTLWGFNYRWLLRSDGC